jgi:predicted kinase
MSGLPFSGKSTLSRAISERLDIPRISFDETWIQIEKDQGVVPGSDDIERWKYINKVCEENARKLLIEGTSVVYDNLGSNFEQRDKIRQLAEKEGAESKVVYLDVEKEEVVKRREANLELKARAQVSDKNFDNALESFEPPREGENVLRYEPSQNIELWIDNELRPKTGELETEQ